MSSSRRPAKKQARKQAKKPAPKPVQKAPRARTQAGARRPAARPSSTKAPRQPNLKAPASKPLAITPAPRPAAAAPRPAIRLPGSASSRLTIKPGPPQGPRPQLELSTRPRPSGPRKLSEVDLEEDEVLIDGFEATLDGQRVKVTAVLERTCVYVDGSGDRRLTRKENLWVEADKLPIRRRGLG